MHSTRTIASLVCGVIAAHSAAPMAIADDLSISPRTRINAEAAIRMEDADASLARVTVEPRLLLRSDRGWRGEVSGRIIAAADETGLGTVSTFSSLSRPLELGEDARLELDRAYVTFSAGDHDLTIGKQTLAWGILDGLQVTDRFDPVDRTEAVFGELRPRRIARWGVRWQGKAAGLNVDAAAALDATVNQLPQTSDAFSPAAPRLRAGIPAGGATPPLRVSSRSNQVRDASLGLRLSRSFTGTEANLVLISGPEPDPLFQFEPSPAGPEVELQYPRRTLIGATLDRADGARIWRLEAAYIPDQPVNAATGPTPGIVERRRILAGLGLDWNLPRDVFLNLQLGLDHVNAGGAELYRPETDLIATIRLQRGFRNERLWLKSEILGTLSEGDGTFRPWVEWRQSDHLTLSAGADLVWGTREGLFGQYRDQSRIWTRISSTF
ncbi:DUF1302 family protein [Hyphomonas sp.]|uniref:DUF1302 family protein n=1 Tax=Hyphomonas sp. TaxID=87 RepID=UPI003918A611